MGQISFPLAISAFIHAEGEGVVRMDYSGKVHRGSLGIGQQRQPRYEHEKIQEYRFNTLRRRIQGRKSLAHNNLLKGIYGFKT
jgi:hypothetical protein